MVLVDDENRRFEIRPYIGGYRSGIVLYKIRTNER